MDLRPYQKDCLKVLWDYLYKNEPCLIKIGTGGGKCHGKGTPILMYNGDIKPVEEIKKGDYLMGPDSKPRLVNSVTTGKEELYNVNPIKGESFICNKSHILSLVSTKNNKVINISIRDYINKNKNFKHLYKLYRTGVDFHERQTVFDPYFSGLYIAEGGVNNPIITNGDIEIQEYIRDFCYKNEIPIRESSGSNCINFHFKSLSRKHNTNKINKLKKYLINSNGDKVIPDCFRVNSRKVRSEFLAGLIDGDGYMHRNTADIVNKSESVASDICFIARSLGFRALMSEKMVKLKNWDKPRIYYRVSISGDLDSLPMKVKRKMAPPRRQKKNVLRTGFSLEEMGTGDYYGFEITGNDNLYLLGDFTVTHNTFIFSEHVRRILIASPHARILILVNKIKLVSQTENKLNDLGVKCGVVCSGLNRREINSPIIIGTIGTVVNCDLEFFNLIIVDEYHRFHDSAVFEKIKNPKSKYAFFTATPYQNNALIDMPIAYEKPMTELINEGYLVPPLLKAPEHQFDTSAISTSKNDFNIKQLSAYVTSDYDKIVNQCQDAIIRLGGRNKVVWACTTHAHCELVKLVLESINEPAVIINSIIKKSEHRENTILFETTTLRHCITVTQITEGYDFPKIDAVVGFRPTRSATLYVQIIGRALRPFGDKKNGLYLDYGGVVEVLGHPSDPILLGEKRCKKKKEKEIIICPQCRNYVFYFGHPKCSCGYLFEHEKKEIDRLKNLSTTAYSKTGYHNVIHVEIESAYFSKAGKPMVKVVYLTRSGYFYEYIPKKPATPFEWHRFYKFKNERDKIENVKRIKVDNEKRFVKERIYTLRESDTKFNIGVS